MAPYVQGLGVSGDLCKSLEAEPVDIYKVRDLWWEASRLSAIDAPVDVSHGLANFSKRRVALDSEEFKGWWSKVQASSSVITRTPVRKLEEREYLMDILTHADVCKIEHLLLNCAFNDNTEGEDISFYDQLGTALSRRDFCKLKSLIFFDERINMVDTKIGSLADALRGPTLMNVRTLSLPRSLNATVLDALAQGSCNLFQLTSFAIGSINSQDLSTFDIIFKSGRLKNLQCLSLDLDYLDDDGRSLEVLIQAIKSHNLPRVVSLRLAGFQNFSLADLFRASMEWFVALEALFITSSGVTSESVCSLVDALMEDPKTRLALTNLDLEANLGLHHRGVLALVRLADSHILPQLQILNLRATRAPGMSLVALVKSIGQGGLSNLRMLAWEYNRLQEADAKTVVQSYYEEQSLTTEITGFDWYEYDDTSLRTKFKTYRDRNLRLAHLRGKFVADFGDVAPLTSAKVFLCGFPAVGKTTLRRALRRSPGLTTTLKESSPKFLKKLVQEPRTRGIEISRIVAEDSGQKTNLVVWDLAGQQEYHVLHGTFLPDMGFVGEKATTFILVFIATVEENGWKDVKRDLGYWLRFVASSSGGYVKRHVVIVLNRFKKKECSPNVWGKLIEDFAKKFMDKLDIHLHPFISDVSRSESVQELKKHLFTHAQASLQGVVVPRVCMELHRELIEEENNNHCHILTWAAFKKMWKLKPRGGNRFSLSALETGAAYLHEMGEIIYFEKVEEQDRESEDGESEDGESVEEQDEESEGEAEDESGDKSILIPNPEWFCREVVGELLLSKEMLSEGGSTINVNNNGSVHLFVFEGYFNDLLVRGIESKDVISLLERVGLCYKKGEEEIIVPTLIRKDDYNSINWKGKGLQQVTGEVTGRCLAVKDTEKNIIPVTLFRRLQVKLALDRDFGCRGDSQYKVGKSFINFKHGELWVLIQFDVNPSDPTDDRIDIQVKSATGGDCSKGRSLKVDCICDIMEKLEELCAVCCDGLTYDIQVIQPSSVADWTDNMSGRELMSLQEIKDLFVKGKEYLAWKVDPEHCVKIESVLSNKEIERLVGTAKQDYYACREDVITMGLLPKDTFNESGAEEGTTTYNALREDLHSLSVSSGGNDQERLTFREDMKAVVRQEGRHTREHIDKLEAVVRQEGRHTREQLLEFRREHELLIKNILEQQSFSSAERGSSVPRYMYLLKKEVKSVVDKVTGAFRYTYQVYFLCESHFDDGFVHEVRQQEGIELKETKEWLVKVSPWIRRSFQVALIVGKAVANTYAPGVVNLILSDIGIPSSSEGSASAVDTAVTTLLDGNCDIGGKAIDVKERAVFQGLVKDLIEKSHGRFGKQTRLSAQVLRAKDVGSSSVAWICDDCLRKYRSDQGNKGHAQLM